MFSRPWMFLGVPTLSLPALTGANGLPIGVQLIGARFADDRLLQAAAWIEQTLQGSPALLVT
ncbi:Glutamyl-tRNA(Gln) amidotransferase subunit A [compost metagenome]